MKELLFSVTKADLKIDYFCAGGPGGQHQNKTSSACRITHAASGAVGESREHREQARNRAAAFKRLTASPKFQLWVQRKSAEILDCETLEQRVERLMAPQNLKVDVKDEKGKWVPEK